MYRHQEQVKEFHEKFDLLVTTKPTIPSEAVLKLRCKLLLEEALEFCEAAGCTFYVHEYGVELIKLSPSKVSLVDMADALTDIIYVTDGAAVSLGIDLQPLSDEVHRSNMSKLWYNKCTCPEISRPYGPAHEAQCPVLGYVTKNADGKVIKPPTYSPADIVGELRKQGFE